MATIHDVALRAGVSPKTISRVLNDQDSVTARTRERVRAAMKALDNRPNAVARHLRSNTAPSMGVLLCDLTSGDQSRFHHAMLLASVETGRHLLLALFDGPVPGWQDRLKAFVTKSGVTDTIWEVA